MLETCRRAGAVPSGPQLAAAPGAPARTRHPPRAQAARARGRVVNAACHIQRIFTGPSGPQSAASWRHSWLAGDRTAGCGRQRAPGIARPLRQQRRIMSDVPPRRLRLPLRGAHAASDMRGLAGSYWPLLPRRGPGAYRISSGEAATPTSAASQKSMFFSNAKRGAVLRTQEGTTHADIEHVPYVLGKQSPDEQLTGWLRMRR